MTDDFIDLPPTTKVLYFFLILEADDDGFVGNPKTVMRLTGATKEDMKLLIEGKYVLLFNTGVVVITDWAEHNSIRKDRKKDTRFTKEMQQIALVEGGKYQWLSDVQPNDNQSAPIDIPNGCIGEDRRGKDSIGEGRAVEVDKEQNQSPTPPPLNQDFVNLYKSFEAEIGKALSPLQIQELQYMLEDFSPELIFEALKEAVSQGKANFAYIRAILNRWKSDNLVTVELVRNSKIARDAKKQNSTQSSLTREEWEENWSEENLF
ncbi:DnaD domain protein [Streptococcus saliviloxodontae]|uniref:DnaD/phage-associated family protein n=1 Tax=Streptococcus saliviloxodontae TaxID=1349416 RepID=A0ABS2PLB6_9STRE|nr:DnaD domain protein [Streptococcus saliviloxodontae]MBM7636228.1 DnaD/phage-associated family protein [Streptococcus saliviloxodontae]